MKNLKQEAIQHLAQGQLAAARPLLTQYCALHEKDAEALFQLADVHGKLGDFNMAEQCLRKLVAMEPARLEIKYSLGIALHLQGKLAESATFVEQVSHSNPNHWEAHFLLARTYFELRKFNEAIQVCQKSLHTKPDFSPARNFLAFMLEKQGRLDEAEVAYRELIRRFPDKPELLSELGLVLRGMGRLDEAMEIYRDVCERHPKLLSAATNMALYSNYMAAMEPKEVGRIHLQAGKAYMHGIQVRTEFHNSPEPGRKLRVGYVSPDMRLHSVAYFFEPLLSSHNPEQFVSVCYSDVPAPDDVTKRLQNCAQLWRNIHGMSTEEVEKVIIDDEIDILVDLTGHTQKNRLELFARRAAPVQISYLGYPNTTGLPTMDYRITDAWADPIGPSDKLYTEQLLPLAVGFLCYRPHENAPDVAPLPANKNGYITFGSFNNLAKFNDADIELWSEILKAVPDSQLLLKNKPLRQDVIAEYVYKQFGKFGIPRDRLKIFPSNPHVLDHLASYGHVDIGLDTFPYNGTTTTCEALWMGVPVIALEGASHAGRVGVSLLNQIGRKEWIANTPQQYVDCAKNLATDVQKLSEIRTTLREKMQASLLCDATATTRDMEKAYRQAWGNWCTEQ